MRCQTPCDPFVTVHLRFKSKTGHDVVDYASKEDDDDACLCDTRLENNCKKCEVPICLLCLSIKHKLHDVTKCITPINDRLQSFGIN